MVVHFVQVITDSLPSIPHLNDSLLQLHWHSPANWTVLAQHINDPDVLGQMQRAFENFIKSGQAGALAIGVVLGYMIRGVTA